MKVRKRVWLLIYGILIEFNQNIGLEEEDWSLEEVREKSKFGAKEAKLGSTNLSPTQ